jgi:hypothetical protein
LNTGVTFASQDIGRHNGSIVPSSNLQEDLLVEVVAQHLLAQVVVPVESEERSFRPEEAWCQVMWKEAFQPAVGLSALGKQVEA